MSKILVIDDEPGIRDLLDIWVGTSAEPGSIGATRSNAKCIASGSSGAACTLANGYRRRAICHILNDKAVPWTKCFPRESTVKSASAWCQLVRKHPDTR